MKNLILFGTSSVVALVDYSTPIATPASSTGAVSANCQGTLRSNFGFITKEWFAAYGLTADKETNTGFACDSINPTSTSCSLAYPGGTPVADTVVQSHFTDKQLALAACPIDYETCGIDSSSKKKTFYFANKEAQAEKPKVKFQKNSDICSFMIETLCDAPTVSIDTSGSLDSELNKASYSIFEFDYSLSTATKPI